MIKMYMGVCFQDKLRVKASKFQHEHDMRFMGECHFYSLLL